MRAYLYALRRNGKWEGRVTIAPEVDRAYWFGGSHAAQEHVEAAWFWKEQLPLGQACQIAEWWRMGERGGKYIRGSDRRGRAKKKAEKRAVSLLEQGASSDKVWVDGLIELECMIRLTGDDAATSAKRGRSWRLWFKRKKRRESGITEAELARLLACAELWRREPNGAARGGVDAAAAERAASLLSGRALLSGEARELLGAGGPGAAASWREAIQLAALLGRVRLRGAVAAVEGGRPDARRRLRCRRCGSGEARLRRSRCLACGRLCSYCEACLTMGRSRECELLVEGVYEPLAQQGLGGGRGAWPAAREAETAPVAGRLAHWGLSPAQLAATEEALHFIEGRAVQGRPKLRVSRQPTGERSDIRNFLLWAVTGAGKTEMVFPLVESVLRRGGRALIASPRRDVVLELDPRIRRAFPEAAVVTLYGGSEQRWERGDITLSTTHQLFRFHHAFDLVILDEIDAYPYHGDPLLKYAADKSCLPGAPRLLLSATPPIELQRAAKRGELAHARVPVRYHRHPLPVPILRRSPPVHAMLSSGKLPASLQKVIQASLDRGAQLFLFVQRIAQSEPFAALLRDKLRLPSALVAATSSQDPERSSKVAAFRTADIRVLVTTTILERGVTIPKSDVIIMDADGKLFDEASLVQMAGRAGRNAADPNGSVSFFAPERNQSQLRAVRHIRTMNRFARARGFLLESGKRGSRS
ncbi:helicase-related protein [Paenibacillus soyae]|uniref:Helicase-related protein n=1 Tax=Paenibacillus soyae TaxID=2969249 RepID=A0A9X2N0C4_9BACL|nr:helicase-related protein [Paenibacillus soyae]MCR2806742.1 helicase-related protein [Paenibacillus soyae]